MLLSKCAKILMAWTWVLCWDSCFLFLYVILIVLLCLDFMTKASNIRALLKEPFMYHRNQWQGRWRKKKYYLEGQSENPVENLLHTLSDFKRQRFSILQIQAGMNRRCSTSSHFNYSTRLSRLNLKLEIP